MTKKQAKIYHFDLFGKRDEKYDFLNKNSLSSVQWQELEATAPSFFFVYKDAAGQDEYEKGFKVDELFSKNACGIVTARDRILVQNSLSKSKEVKSDFLILSENDFRKKYNENKDSRDWTYQSARNDIENSIIVETEYRPFDRRFILYSAKSKGILSYPRNDIMRNMIISENIALLITKQLSTFDFQHIFVTKLLSDKCTVSLQTKEASYHFPLYLYPENESTLLGNEKSERVPNFNMEIVAKIAADLELEFLAEEPSGNLCFAHNNDELRDDFKQHFTALNLLDYIYAVLHSPTYREKYKEFLKIDFPRLPYPSNTDSFWKMVNFGSELRQIHLLECSKVNHFITQYPNDGSNEVTRKLSQNSPGFVPTGNGLGQVWINDEQYFDKVPETAWDFYIGGYQPAQKWLKDRIGRTLSFEEILHYQKIIVALSETDQLMKEIG